jgi:Tol biopolymer transport system component
VGQSSYDDFQKALRAEHSEGDLEKAIALYEQVENRTADRSLAAKAQLRIGLCYERMGLTDARKAYQRVIRVYRSQEREVALAKERLAALAEARAPTSSLPRFRTVRIPGNLDFLSSPQLSPDGQKLAFAFDSALWLLPVEGKVNPDIAGAPIRLTEPVGVHGAAICWSFDGQWIAFNTREQNVYRIRSDGKELAELSLGRDCGAEVNDYRISLSPDGTQIAFSSFENRTSYIFTAPVEGGAAKQLTDTWSREPAFSPDGTKIAYVKLFEPWNDQAPGEIWVVPASGGVPVLVSDLRGRLRGPIWSPDGSKIAFYRGPLGKKPHQEIWIVPVAQTGQAMGPPTRIELPRPTRLFLSGWTLEDVIGIPFLTPFHSAVYTVPSDGGKALQVTPPGLVRHPRWTPDGERIFFRWGAGNTAFVPAGGGEVTIVEKRAANRIVEVTSGGGNVISPDGSTIAFSAYQEGSQPAHQHIWTMPVDGGEPIELTRSPGGDRFPRWSHDGAKIAFIRAGTGDSVDFGIWTIPTEGGDSTQVTLPEDQVRWSPIGWSPDGNLIAYFSKGDTIRVIPAQGGNSWDVVEVDDHTQENELAWSPDSQEIVYTSDGRIWRVSLSEGRPREVKTGGVGSVTNIDWSPDGESFAIIATSGGQTVLGLMEDFLTVLNGK